MEEVYVPKNPREKAMQRALIQYRDPKNYEIKGKDPHIFPGKLFLQIPEGRKPSGKYPYFIQRAAAKGYA